MRKKYGLWIILGLFCLVGSIFLFRGNLEKDDFYSYVNRIGVGLRKLRRRLMRRNINYFLR